MLRLVVPLLISLIWCCSYALAETRNNRNDLNTAIVVIPQKLSAHALKAVNMLVEEVEKRTQIRWNITHEWPEANTPVIAVGLNSDFQMFAPEYASLLDHSPISKRAEGYQIRTTSKKSVLNTAVVLVSGNDERGVLFGLGRLLRNLQMERQLIALLGEMNISSSPHSKIRGHQLGYRPKTNSYDGWNLAQWDQYIRELAVFGANSIELIPPRSDDDADSPHFPLPPMETMIGMSKIIDSYGLDVWIWYPAMDKDYSDPATVEFALKEWGDVFKKLPRIDAVLVPGGDPGHTQPKYLMYLLEKEAEILHQTHPKAQMWVAPQGFSQVWLDEFLQILRDEDPKWLHGIVFGPQVRVSLPRLRQMIPARFPIRHYPDITHSKICQYPVPNWDLAYALTEGREGINPRPLGEAQIIHAFQKYTEGSITYSEGCNDDVNKTVWSALEWDPDMPVVDVLRDYSRFYIGERFTESFAQGLLALERNWQGPLSTNEGVATTLHQFQALERAATPQNRLNWRFQQALYRAYYDAYVRSRLNYEQEIEARAMEILGKAKSIGSITAIDDAEKLINSAPKANISANLRSRVFELGEALFQSIHMQLSVERYQAIAVERGANLDSIDEPLNNRLWLKARFEEIRKQTDEPSRLRLIKEIIHWTDPGPGGFYDEPGNLNRRDHLVSGASFADDPGTFEGTRIGFTDHPGRLSWSRHIESLYDNPLKMHYTNLDRHALFKVRLVYGGDAGRKVRMMANDTFEIHPLQLKPAAPTPLEFDIPMAATDSGELTLSWFPEPGRGGNGRGCQISEIWLIRK